VLSSGAYPGETDVQRGRRRIVVGYLFFGALVRLTFAALNFDGGESQIGVMLLSFALVSVIALVALRLEPGWFVGIVYVLLVFQVVEPLVETVAQGGLAPSGMVILYGILAVLGALIVLSVRQAFWSFLAFVFTVVLAVALPNWIEPLTVNDAGDVGIAINTIVATSFVFAGMAYFVRQRDRFQRESDDLLHNILPHEIATRLKSNNTIIADDYESASVLFADMVDFTPMSAAMTPSQLIALLNDLFAAFDGFVEELGLEKIRTVGDEYMVAAGVPQ